MNYNIIKFKKIESTNKYLEKQVEEGLLTDTLVIAEEQICGIGQKDKYFYSPCNTGIYFSLLHFYKDNFEIEDITIKVGNLINNILKNDYNINTRVKLINDIYKDDKKVVGILCKNIIAKKAVIVGIGIDLYKNDNTPDDLKNIVGYIFDKKIDTDKLINKIVRKIYEDCFMER